MIAESSGFRGCGGQDVVFLDFRLGANQVVDALRALLQDAVVYHSFFTFEFNIDLFVERFW